MCKLDKIADDIILFSLVLSKCFNSKYFADEYKLINFVLGCY